MKYVYKKTAPLLISILLIINSVSLTGCSDVLSSPVTVTDFKLNTFVSVAAYTTGGHSRNELDSILEGAISLCDHYENIFSRTRQSSTLSQVNSGSLNTIPRELGDLIKTGIEYGQLSNGAFDITIGSIVDLWDFTGGSNVPPDASAVTAALKHVDYRNINLSQNDDFTYNISIPPETVIDLGAIAKGYIADRIKEYLISNGIDSAIINLGGNVLCVGSKNAKSLAGGSNADFNIGIKKPFTENGETVTTVGINDLSVVSSGNYERFYIYEDSLYHHILNPADGYPVNNGLSGVTIISSDSITGDCLSTTCFILGLEKAVSLINSLPDVEAMFIDSDGGLHYSENFIKYVID